jgi:hypothetical protein
MVSNALAEAAQRSASDGSKPKSIPPPRAGKKAA